MLTQIQIGFMVQFFVNFAYGSSNVHLSNECEGICEGNEAGVGKKILNISKKKPTFKIIVGF